MPLWRFAKITLLCALLWLCVCACAAASEYHGTVTFGGLPVPGATIIAAQGAKKFTTVTDLGGVYHFDDLPNGHWTITVEMQCFATIHAQVSVAPNTPAGNWELTLLPLKKLMAATKVEQNPLAAHTAPGTESTGKKPEASQAGNASAEIPRPPESSDERSADGFLVNGSVNNAATSRYSTNPAFGNTRSGSRGLYTGGFATILDNSATDARPYSISGFETPKNAYDLITNAIYVGGPIRIPHLLPHGPDFFVNYQWTRNNNAAINTGLVPTVAERTGDLSGLLDAQGQPVTIYDPSTGMPFLGNQVPLSAQAAALLQLFPLPNPNIPVSSGYNYQAAVLNSTHQDSLESRMEKTLGRKNQMYGGFNFQSTRAASVNLFGFVDTTDTLGLNANINWAHRFSQHLFLYTGYHFSRLRTLVRPNFDNRENISGAAGINGNDQDPADWGPPSLNFSSGFAALSDANSAFNRNRTDSFSVSAGIYRGRHNISVGGDFRKQEYNDFFQQNPRGGFTFTGAATAGGTSSGSDLADFLIGVPDTSGVAFGNADKYFREPVYDAYFTDDWRMLSSLTINAGMRWEYGAPITELKGRLVNLDITSGFAAGAPVLGSDPVGPLTGTHYPASLVRPDRLGIEPRVGVSWRPFAASTVVVRAGYGIYRDTSVYQSIALEMAQQAPLSKSLSVANSSACPLTLSDGFNPCATVTSDTFAIDPNYHIGYAQTWQLSVQRDLPAAMQVVATYFGVKGTHGAQEFLPNTNPIGAANPCPDCPSGFVYRTSGGNSTRESGQVQLRRRLRSGFTASLEYTYSKSIDDDAQLGGQGYVSSSQSQSAAGSASSPAAIAQNWRDLRAERALSTFDQRNLLSLTAQYTSGEGLGGGSLMSGWRGRLLKEWTIVGTVTAGSGLPETPIYPAAVPGTGFTSIIRPSLTGASVYESGNSAHLNSAAYTAPLSGEWGTAGRDSIIGPSAFSLNNSLARTFRPHGRLYLDLRVDSTNTLNHAAFTSWNAIVGNAQFGLPIAAGPMRSLQTTIRLRF